MKEAQELREPTEQYYAQPLEVRSFVVYRQRRFDIKLRPSACTYLYCIFTRNSKVFEV